MKVAKNFRKSALYSGMREMFEDPNMKYPADLEEEINGTPTYFSTCDNNLLVYTVMTSSIKAQSFTFLKEIM